MFGVASAAVVAGAGAGLVESSPVGSGQPVADAVGGVGEQATVVAASAASRSSRTLIGLVKPIGHVRWRRLQAGAGSLIMTAWPGPARVHTSCPGVDQYQDGDGQRREEERPVLLARVCEQA